MAKDDPELVWVAWRQDAIAATAHFLLVDLDNRGGNPGSPGAGPYKHDDDNALLVRFIQAILTKSASNGEWSMSIGVIVRIDGTDADVVVLTAAPVNNEDTLNFTMESNFTSGEDELLDCTVDSGELLSVASDTTITTTDFQDDTTVKDIAGNDVLPAVGDLVIRVEKVGGTGTVAAQMLLNYMAN